MSKLTSKRLLKRELNLELNRCNSPANLGQLITLQANKKLMHERQLGFQYDYKVEIEKVTTKQQSRKDETAIQLNAQELKARLDSNILKNIKAHKQMCIHQPIWWQISPNVIVKNDKQRKNDAHF